MRRREQDSCVIVRVWRVELCEIDTSLDWGSKSCAVSTRKHDEKVLKEAETNFI